MSWPYIIDFVLIINVMLNRRKENSFENAPSPPQSEDQSNDLLEYYGEIVTLSTSTLSLRKNKTGQFDILQVKDSVVATPIRFCVNQSNQKTA